MRLLYLPNEPELGFQVGARIAFADLEHRGLLSAVETYSFHLFPPAQAMEEILALAKRFEPDVILIGKLGPFPVTSEWLGELKNLRGFPILAYFDGDVYGRVFKRFTPNLQTIAKFADYVFICALGELARMYRAAGARRVCYRPLDANLTHFGADWTPTRERELDVVMIANRIPARVSALEHVSWGRMSGAYERDQLVRMLGKAFGSRFGIYGRGWSGFRGDRGPVAYDAQIEQIRRSQISVGVNHFPHLPLYFSDRLSISLLSGVPHVAQYHRGYELFFENGRELLWAESLEEIVETTRMALAESREFLDELGRRGRSFAHRYLTSGVIYEDMIRTILGAPSADTLPARVRPHLERFA